MAAAVIMIAFIVLFVGTIVLIQFPEVATEIYITLEAFIGYISESTGILWFFLPKTLTLTVLGLVMAIEVIFRAFLLFQWIYERLKQ